MVRLLADFQLLVRPQRQVLRAMARPLSDLGWSLNLATAVK
jgi:hypothetical protein